MFENGISISDNFDELMAMASEKPEEFELLRERLINMLIGSLPEKRQVNMRRYQWRIDQETRRHDSRLGCCIKLSTMMSERMLDMQRQLDLILRVSPEQFSARFSQLENAVVKLKNTVEA